MNDYLTNLAARSFDYTAPIQPRLPSLFEFSSQAEKTFFWQSNVGEGNGESAAEFQPAEAKLDPADIRTARGSANSVTLETVSRASDSKAEPRAEKEIRAQIADPIVRPSAITNDETNPALTRTFTGQRLRDQISEHPSQLPATNKVETNQVLTQADTGQQPQAVLRPSIERAVMEPAASLENRGGQVNSGVEPVPDQTASPPSPLAVVVRPSVTPLLEPPRSATLGLQDSRLKPTSTIQVTIGRVEVRAISATAPAVDKRASPLSPISLEEYLRRRSGGGDK